MAEISKRTETVFLAKLSLTGAGEHREFRTAGFFAPAQRFRSGVRTISLSLVALDSEVTANRNFITGYEPNHAVCAWSGCETPVCAEHVKGSEAIALLCAVSGVTLACGKCLCGAVA